MTTKEPTKLHRYTSLPALLYLLHNRKLTLLSPDKWEDKNDVQYMKAYKSRLSLRCVLAVCFAQGAETFHYWRVFTSGSDGVRIEFDRKRLLNRLQQVDGIECREVDYKYVYDLERKLPQADDLPFLKRYPFRDEAEYRIVYSSKKRLEEDSRAKDFSIDLNMIRRITLSPWLSKALVDATKKTIRSVDGCDRLLIAQSQLVEFQKWIDLATPTDAALAKGKRSRAQRVLSS
jgi:hypothetical protein